MPGVDNPFSLCHTLTTTHPESHGTNSCTNSTVFAFHATILTRIQDGKIMNWNNYTGTSIDKGLILSGCGMQTQFFVLSAARPETVYSRLTLVRSYTPKYTLGRKRRAGLQFSGRLRIQRQKLPLTQPLWEEHSTRLTTGIFACNPT
jgi:hypothetical protein